MENAVKPHIFQKFHHS